MGDATPPAARRPRWMVLAAVALAAAVPIVVFPQQIADGIVASGVSLPSPVVETLNVAGIPLQNQSTAFDVLYRNPDGSPVTWKTCTVQWVYDPSGAPSGAFAVITEAFTKASDLTGIDFVYAGEVQALPQQGWAPARQGEGFEPVQVVWASPASTDVLTGAENAVALPAVLESSEGSALVGGAIVFNRETAGRLSLDFERGSGLGAVALHEIGHLVGLAHVQESASLMHPGGRQWRFGLTEGDRAGFAAMGHHCLLPPAARAATG